jgi:hypothetical protein
VVPAAAGPFIRRGIRLVSVVQSWPRKCNQRAPVLREPDRPEARAALTELFAPVAAPVPDDPASATDGVVVWECR